MCWVKRWQRVGSLFVEADLERVLPAGRPESADVLAGHARRAVLDGVAEEEGVPGPQTGVGYGVVGQADDAVRLVELVAAEHPDLAIVDIGMPPEHSTEGLTAARTIRERHPDTGLLVLSAFAEFEEALVCSKSGRKVGCLLKNRVTVVDPSLVRELFSAQRRDDPLAHLGGREREVLALMAEGRSNAGLGRGLWVTEEPSRNTSAAFSASSTSRRTRTTTAVSWRC